MLLCQQAVVVNEAATAAVRTVGAATGECRRKGREEHGRRTLAALALAGGATSFSAVNPSPVGMKDLVTSNEQCNSYPPKSLHRPTPSDSSAHAKAKEGLLGGGVPGPTKKSIKIDEENGAKSGDLSPFLEDGVIATTSEQMKATRDVVGNEEPSKQQEQEFPSNLSISAPPARSPSPSNVLPAQPRATADGDDFSLDTLPSSPFSDLMMKQVSSNAHAISSTSLSNNEMTDDQRKEMFLNSNLGTDLLISRALFSSEKPRLKMFVANAKSVGRRGGSGSVNLATDEDERSVPSSHDDFLEVKLSEFRAFLATT